MTHQASAARRKSASTPFKRPRKIISRVNLRIYRFNLISLIIATAALLLKSQASKHRHLWKEKVPSSFIVKIFKSNKGRRIFVKVVQTI